MVPPPSPPTGGGGGEAGPSSGDGKEEAGGNDDAAPPSMPLRMGFSLSLAASKKPAAAAALKPAALGGGVDVGSREPPRRELITGVAGGKIASADPSASSRGVAKKPPIIPALQNTFKVGRGGGGGAKKAEEEEARPTQRYLPESINADASKTNEERFVSAGPEEAQRKGLIYGLQTMGGRTDKKEGGGGGGGEAGGDKNDGKATDSLAGLSVTSREWEAARYKQDLSWLPEEGKEEDYERMPVESFARALLRGMGWKEDDEGGDKGGNGTATAVTREGRKIDVGVVEFLPRPAGLGLGASLGPSVAAAPKRDRRWETAAARPGGPPPAAAAAPPPPPPPPRGTTMVDASGRVRHSRRLGEELRPSSEFGAAAASLLRPGARVFVCGGAHSGVSASVIGLVEAAAAAAGGIGGASLSSSSSPSSSSGSPALVRIRLFPSDEEVVVRREYLEEASRGGASGSGDRKRGGGGKGERGRRSPPPPPHAPPLFSASKRQRRRSRSRSRSPPPPPPPPSAKWLLPGIVVKIVDKRLEGGRFYLKRARVLDVPAPGIATLAIVSSAASAAPFASLSGVRASSLETAVPRTPGAAVVVVEGRHRGRRGKLLARMEVSSSSSSKSKEPMGTVQLRGDLEVVQLPFDWFAEAANADEESGVGGGGEDDDDDE